MLVEHPDVDPRLTDAAVAASASFLGLYGGRMDDFRTDLSHALAAAFRQAEALGLIRPGAPEERARFRGEGHEHPDDP
jgi:hypothetical protein